MDEFEDLRVVVADYKRLAGCKRLAVEIRRRYAKLAAAYEQQAEGVSAEPFKTGVTRIDHRDVRSERSQPVPRTAQPPSGRRSAALAGDAKAKVRARQR